ncbi:hypothetical protein BX666DRAFT_1848476 [Dichotomocladium elegans]|nr:hypothetical protein BX666DRAFT_1848476 [Dichotomocladium elegans]
MLQQSQVLNVLPRRILANLWASHETRVTLSHFIATTPNHAYRSPTSPSFLCSELPIRYMHILRLLSTLPPDALQSPIIRHVSHRYLHDMCTLLHPSLHNTSRRAFTNLMRRLRMRQAASLIRLRYALSGSATALMDNINIIGLGIQFLTDQHLSSLDRVQVVRPMEIAMQAVEDVRQVCASCFGNEAPKIITTQKGGDGEGGSGSGRTLLPSEFLYTPSALHRVLFESILVAVRTHMASLLGRQQPQKKEWTALFRPQALKEDIRLDVFGGPTSIGFRLDSPTPLAPGDLQADVPRDPVGIPITHTVLSTTEARHLRDDDVVAHAEWHAWSGWRAAKAMAAHWGGNLDAMSVQGLGTTVYLALDRDPTLLERYPAQNAFRRRLHHSPQTQLDAFLDAISQPATSTPLERPIQKDHSVSLSAAVAAAVAHA